MYNILICGTFRGIAFGEEQEAEMFVKEMIAAGERPENLEIFYNNCQNDNHAPAPDASPQAAGESINN